MLDEKIECSECHRVFFAKTTAGKRVAAPDHTKVYIGFGVAIVAIIGLFVMSGGSSTPPKKPKKAPAAKPAAYSTSDHPRAVALEKWAKALGANDQLVLATHTDIQAIAPIVGLGPKVSEGHRWEKGEVIEALRTHESTELLRTMDCTAMLASEDAMTADTGTGKVFVTPKSGDDRFKRNTRGEFTVTFKATDNRIQVNGFTLRLEPVWSPGKKPGTIVYKPNQDIAAPEQKTITDSSGTRVVQESEPAAVPHWKGATPELRALADQVVADIIRSADNSAPASLFNRATMKVRTMEEKQAAVPRVLNAMFDRYSDVNKNNLELSQLNRALIGWTGYAVNYQVPDKNPAKDKVERESAIRQWFAFWWRYHEDLSQFFDESEDLEIEDESGGK